MVTHEDLKQRHRQERQLSDLRAALESANLKGDTARAVQLMRRIRALENPSRRKY